MNRQVSQGREGPSSPDSAIAIGLLLASLAVRWLSTGGDVLGDESWYLYLARTFAREPEAQLDHAWFHLLNRPLYYAIFHFGSYAGFAGFRWYGCVVGAVHVATAFAVARALGASRFSAVAVSCVLCVERPLVEYGSHGFPDPLASVFALAAIWSALRQRAASTCLLALCCVLSKESFVALPCIATYVRLSVRTPGGLRPDAWAWATLLLPAAYVATITSIGAGTQGIALQGWANTLMSWKHARGMWVGPELWPLIAWCVWQRRWMWLVIWLGLPAFYLLWSFGLGRGLAPWYVVGPASLSAVAVAVTISDLQAKLFPKLTPLHRRVVDVALFAALLPVARSGIFRTGAQVLALQYGPPKLEVGEEVVSVIEQLKPEQVLLVDCFWSYGYSHLRGAARPATRAYWPANDDLSELQSAAHAARVTVLCREPNDIDKEQKFAAQGFHTLLQDARYWVLETAVVR